MKKLNAFTMLELVFVILIIGIIGKFGLEFITQAYNNYLISSVNNTLQSNGEYALEFISKRLQDRIKSSVIVKNATTGNFVSIADGDIAIGGATVLEWIGSDVDGFRGNSPDTSAVNLPNWSGIIDIQNPTVAQGKLNSPGTSTTATGALINILSRGTSGFNDSAIYFIGSNEGNIQTDYGWQAGALANQGGVIHPVNSDINEENFAPAVGTWSGVEVYEYYKLAWSAYALSFENIDANGFGELAFYYDYQPWNRDTYLLQSDGATPTKRTVLMQNVTSFRFMAINTMIKVQVCVGSDLVSDPNMPNGGHSVCKEKSIF